MKDVLVMALSLVIVVLLLSRMGADLDAQQTRQDLSLAQATVVAQQTMITRQAAMIPTPVPHVDPCQYYMEFCP